MNKNNIGIIGMSVMGSNLALNIANNGYNVSIFNRTPDKTKILIKKYNSINLKPFYSLENFVNSLIKPKIIILMVKSGKSTDNIINNLLNFLKKDDIIIDGGNSYFKDSKKRYNKLIKKNINFIDAGISGGEKGALYGPSIMIGGDKNIYNKIKSIFKNISAKFNKIACASYIGPNSTGHFVKMIHNGIEYGNMQLISEIYFLLKQILNLNNKEISNIFNLWNKNELNSYLIEITKDIFIKKNENNKYLIDLILDKAENKGTGKWNIKNALDLGVPLNIISESIFARYLSTFKIERIKASKLFNGPKNNKFLKNKIKLIEKMRCALYLAQMLCYSQGFNQLKIASEKYNWQLNLEKIAKTFRSGCIIRAKLLEKIVEIYNKNSNIKNLMLSDYFIDISNKYNFSLREVVSLSISNGISVPSLASAISFYDGYRSEFSPANLIQAQRDFFGSHTYEIINKIGKFHTNW